MELVGYYRRFIKGFSKIVHPITSLKIKEKRFIRSPEFEDSFQQLKHILTNAHVLKIVDPEKNFQVFTDDFKERLGGVLMQEWQVIFHESWKISEHEKKYVTHYLELATIVHALEM